MLQNTTTDTEVITADASIITVDEVRQVIPDHSPLYVGSGTTVLVHMVPTASVGTVAVHVRKVVNGVRTTSHQHTAAQDPGGKVKISKMFSTSLGLSSHNGAANWTTADFIEAHSRVVRSGLHNFEGCKIPIPTLIRYDRFKVALGNNITAKDQRVLDLLEFGMPLDCNESVGVKKQQRNHFSAVSYPKAIEDYLGKDGGSNAILGPFDESPILDLRFSPLMTVPKEESKRRVIVDFSFPAGHAINDGISKATYLDHKVEFSLPSVQSMIGRINALGKGCLLYKRDLKSAFRQFSTDPGDYRFTGMSWKNKIYIDTRLAMGLRSSAFCCQSVTEIVAKIASEKAHGSFARKVTKILVEKMVKKSIQINFIFTYP